MSETIEKTIKKTSYNAMMKDQKYYTLINTNLNYLLDTYDIVVFNQIIHICNIERGYSSLRFMNKILNISINRINKSIQKLKSIGMIDYKSNHCGGTNFFSLNVDIIKEIYDNCNNTKIEYRIQYCKELLSKLDKGVSSEDTGVVLEDVIIDTLNDVTVSPHDTGGVSPHDTGVSPHDTGVSPRDTGCVTTRYTYKEDITNQYKRNNKNEINNKDVIFSNLRKIEIETIDNCNMNNSFSLNDNSNMELELNETKFETIETNDSSSLNETKENCNNDIYSLIELTDISTKVNTDVLNNNSNEDNETITVNEKEAETGSLECLNEYNDNSNEDIFSLSFNEELKQNRSGANDSSSFSLRDISNEEDILIIELNDNPNDVEEDILIIELNDNSNKNETNSFECAAARPAPADDFNCELYLQQQLNKVCDIFDNLNLKWYERKENIGWIGNVTRNVLSKRYTSSEVNVLIGPLFNAIDILIEDIDTNLNTNRISYQYN